MRTRSLKQTTLAGLAGLALVGATLGVAGAQAQPPTASPSPARPASGQPSAEHQARHQQFLNSVASKLAVAPERLQQAMDATRQELGIPEGGPRGGHGPGGRGPGGPGGPGRHLDAAAQALNISVDQLRQELPGKTLTQVAQARNVNPTTVANAMKAAANTQIDQAVTAGKIPSDQAAQAKQQAATRIDQMMTNAAPTGQPGAGRPGPGGQTPGSATPGTQGR